MHIIPWRKHDAVAEFKNELGDFFHRFDDPFNGSMANRLGEVFQRRTFPALNVSESEKDFALSVELPGLEEKDIQIELMGNQLKISGERKWEKEKKGKEFFRVESQYGTFERTVELPDGLRLDRESIQATYTRGMLEIRIPKLEPTPAARIPVKAG